MSIAELFRRALVRRVVYLLVAFVLVPVGIGRAQAQDFSGCFTNETTSRWCPNRSDSYSSVKIAARHQLTVNQGRQQGEDRGWFGYQCNATYCSVYYEANSPQGHTAQAQRQWPVGADCPDGGTWNDSTHTCDVPNRDDEECQALNSGIASQGPVTRTWTSKCLDSGCNAVLDDYSTIQNSIGDTFYQGTLRYTGGCAAPPSDPDILDGKNDDNKPRDECTPAGSGQTMCIKPNGEQCYTAGTGRQICWKVGETGDKTDGPVLQKRQPGTPVPPATLDLANGDTATKTGTSITTTTTINNGPTVNTTTTNYTTASGADAGKSNDGRNADGSDDGKDDGKEGEKGSASPDCASPPTCSSTDSIGCAMLRQTWLNHCKWAKDSTDPDPSDFSGVPGIESTGEVFEDEAGADDILGTLPSGGWASRGQCPIDMSFSVGGKTFNLSGSQLCSLLDALAALILIAAGIRAAVIVGGGYK